jgi:hypothetical protein
MIVLVWLRLLHGRRKGSVRMRQFSGEQRQPVGRQLLLLVLSLKLILLELAVGWVLPWSSLLKPGLGLLRRNI